MKKLEDYIHLYLGAYVLYTPPESAPIKCKLVGFTRHEEGIIAVTSFEADGDDGYEGFGYRHDTIDYIELLLRPLGSMTEEEKKEYNQRKQRKGYMPSVHAINTIWLLSKGFDLFDLIPAGLALDSTLIEKV